MPVDGRRHPLIIYTTLLDRWRKPVLAIGLAILGLAGGLAWLPTLPTGLHFLWVPDSVLWLAAGTGGFGIVLSLLLVVMRRSAYVQPFRDHLRLATPFLKLNISYRRILRQPSARNGGALPACASGRRARDLRASLSSRTVVVLDLTASPSAAQVFGMFLSPFFFPDRTPRLALLVPDWIGFRTELESYPQCLAGDRRNAASNPREDLLGQHQSPGS